MYPTVHYHLTWGGTSGTGAESWTCGLRLWNIGLNINTSDQTWEHHYDSCFAAVAAARTLLLAFHVDGVMHMNPLMNLSWVKLNPVDSSGKQNSLLNTVEDHVLTANAGGGSPGAFENALVGTLRTAMARGRGHAGRIYLPVGTMTYDGSDGRIAATSIAPMAHRLGKLIYDLNHISTWTISGTDVTPQVSIVSNRSGKNDTSAVGPVYPVTYVQIGDILDVQRRRRRQQIEYYTGGVLSSTGS